MAIWAVENGYMGDGWVTALVSAPTEEDAKRQARALFAAAEYGAPTNARRLDLPCLVEIS